MSDRLISADVLKSSILQWQFKIGQDGIWYVLGLIDSTPTIEAEPRKHGMWLKTAQSLVFPEKFRNYFCSECGLELDKSIRAAARYCPYCGADMRGSKDE